LSDLQSLLEMLLSRVGIKKPDGRPLYRYRVTDREFEHLTQLVRDDWMDRPPWSTGALTLLASEAVCRGHREGAWSWAPLWEALGRKEDVQQWLHPRLERGGEWWGFPLILATGSRRFLTTVALQGGLPRALLAGGADGGPIGRYFTRLLKEHERFPTVDPVELAKDLEGHVPRTLRQTEMRELSAALVVAVRRLRREAGTTDDPVAALDRQHPGWRNELPIHFDQSDQGAERLVRGLLQAPRVEAARGRRIELTLELISKPEARVVRRLRLPPLVPVGDLWPLSEDDAPTFMPLALRTGEGRELMVAEAYLQVRDGQAAYRLEATRSLELDAAAHDFGEVALLVLPPRLPPIEIAVQGGEDLSEVPWAFEPVEDVEETAPLLIAGSGSTRTASVLVALPPESRRTDGAWAHLGTVAGSGRELYRLEGDGSAEIEGERYSWRTSTRESLEYLLGGRLASVEAARGIAWRGAPALKSRTDEDDPFTAVPNRELAWRPDGAGAQSMSMDSALGSGVLRWVRGGATVCRTRLTILPDDLEVRLESDRGGGRIELSSRRLREVRVPERADLSSSVERFDGRVVVSLERDGGTAAEAPRLNLELLFDRAQRARVRVPLPFAVAEFTGRDSRPLRWREVALDDLEHVRAVVVGAGPRSAPQVVMALGHRPSVVLATIPLPEVGAGRHELRLEPSRAMLEEVISLDDEQEHEQSLRVTLEVDGQEKQRLIVARYSARIRNAVKQGLNPRGSHLLIEKLDGEQVPIDDPQFLEATCVLRPAWRPGALGLPAAKSTEGFLIPWSGLHEGWWVAVLEGDRHARCVRPTAFEVPESPELDDEELAPRGRLELAARAPFEVLSDTIDGALRELEIDDDEAAVQSLVEILETLQTAPASTYRTTSRLVLHPVALCRAVLALPSTGPGRAAWTSLEELGFLWSAVPISAWRSAIDLVVDRFDREVQPLIVKGLLEGLEHQAADRFPWLSPVLWGLAVEWGLKEAPRPAPRAALDRPQIQEVVRASDDAWREAASTWPDARVVTKRLDNLRNELRNRHDRGEDSGVDRWPTIDIGSLARGLGVERLFQSLRLKTHVQRARAVVDGTALAAAWLVRGSGHDANFVSALKLVRAFDREWFDRSLSLQIPRAFGFTRLETLEGEDEDH